MAKGPSKAEIGVLWEVGTLVGLDDSALLARFGDRLEAGADLAFEVLVRRHGPMVFRVCSQLLGDRHAAEDAFQAVFVVLARRAGSIRSPERLAPWLHGVALRTARESRSREIKRRRLDRRGVTMQPSAPVPPESPLIRAEDAEVLHSEIARLPDRYRGPVVLCDLQGLTQQEAATRLRCPVGTVAIRLKRAKERLRDRLARRGLDPTAVLMAWAFEPSGDVPIPPPSLIDATVRASTAAGAATASVVSLVRGVEMSLSLTRAKTMAALALGLASACGVTASLQSPPAKEDAAPLAPLERTVGRVVTRVVREREDYLGRAESPRTREVRTRVGDRIEIDPIAVGFDVDERTYLKLRRLYGDDWAKAAEGVTVRMALLDEPEFSRPGQLESLPDRLDPATGTGRFRATMPNPDGLVLPGMVVRVWIATIPPRTALLVPRSAIVAGTNPSVYELDARGVVEERRVKLGRPDGEDQVILEGLKDGDRVVVGDLEGVVPGRLVKPSKPPLSRP